jgi:hypothetical protein
MHLSYGLHSVYNELTQTVGGTFMSNGRDQAGIVAKHPSVRWAFNMIVFAMLALAGAGEGRAQSCPGGVPGGLGCVASGQTLEVTAHGVCRRVTNPQGRALLIPHASAAEWQSLRDTGGSGLLLLALCYSYGWSEWSGWSGCSASCGGGTQSRGRECRRSEASQAGYSVVDASLCGGASSESQACNTHSCCTPNNQVTGYGGCSASCGGGQQDVYWSNGCGATWTTQQACNTHSCGPPAATLSISLTGATAGFTATFNQFEEHWWNWLASNAIQIAWSEDIGDVSGRTCTDPRGRSFSGALPASGSSMRNLWYSGCRYTLCFVAQGSGPNSQTECYFVNVN